MTTVDLLDVPAAARWIAERGPERIIGELTDALAADFRRWPDLDKRPRIASHSAEGVIELMPTSDGATYGFKYVNGHPVNPQRGFQTVTAFGVLADVHNGYPTFVAEMTLLTALRTAATSALAARTLARKDSRTLALIGTGSQAEFQALGMRSALGINRLRAWDVDPAAREKLVRNARSLGFEVHDATSAADAVRGADVITTCTADKRNATVLTHAMLADAAPGVHINAIGGDCPGKTELEASILTAPGTAVVVEYEPQTRIEGEIQQLPADSELTELWQILTGDAPGRTNGDQVTVFDSVGFAVEDWTALRYVHAAVLADPAAGELLQQVDLIAEPTDPKDLWSLVAAEALQPQV
ncbi:ornithine cyclodeaminase [Isoptericola halotolerans]|uniref:Ornithine cyclodeaminase n=1 Tax=Isoptericola halotolerans TaxID=300560 RepID=A0ABX2A6Y9_9MICO|nr:ornithine cyclodeaminase [Isoptericola halotolerans]NOV98475.1 ornithine cyclodeaminase [Isoptericola halotolerans]